MARPEAQPTKEPPYGIWQGVCLLLCVASFAFAVWIFLQAEIVVGVIFVVMGCVTLVLAAERIPALQRNWRYQHRYGGTADSLYSMVDVDRIRRIRDEQGPVAATRALQRQHREVPLRDLAAWVKSL